MEAVRHSICQQAIHRAISIIPTPCAGTVRGAGDSGVIDSLGAILHEGLDLKMNASLEVGQVRGCGRQNRGSKPNLGVRAGFLEKVNSPLRCGCSRSLSWSWDRGRDVTKLVKGRLSLDVLIHLRKGHRPLYPSCPTCHEERHKELPKGPPRLQSAGFLAPWDSLGFTFFM